MSTSTEGIYLQRTELSNRWSATTTFVALLWTILLCVEIFVLFDTADATQSQSRLPASRRASRTDRPTLASAHAGNLVGVLIFVDAMTAIALPIL